MKRKKHRSLLERFNSIRSSILVSFSVLMLAALIVFMFVAFNYTKSTVMENSITNTTRLINQVNFDIDSYIDYMENISSMVAQSEDVANYLFSKDESLSIKKGEKERIVAQFLTVMESRQDIYSMGAVKDNDIYILNEGDEGLNENVDVTKQEWYQEALNSENGMALSSSHVQNAINSSYKWVITLSRAIVNPATNVREGVFFIDLNYSAISNLCDNNKIGNKGYVFVVDDDANLIYHPKQQLMYGGLKTEIVDQVMECDDEYLLYNEEQDTKLYTMSKSEKTGWTVVGTAYISELLKDNQKTQMIYFMVSIVLLFCVVVTSSIIARGITRPIAALRDSMKKVEKGDFEQANLEVYTNNELGGLSNSFNIMTKRIQELMEQNIYEQKQKRKSELRALQSQINPHFLYNTLDSIIWMAEGKKNEEVVLMTSALARLLRQSISNENELVMLSQEIMIVQSYLTIQKMRYKDKLEYTIDVDPEVNQASIIKLVLQPLIENAIYHGLKYKETKGMLSLKAYGENDKVIIEIEDDGVGMDEETLKHIFDEHKVNYHSNGVGVYNVQKRLKLYYGNEYGLLYESTPKKGTKVTVTIPQDGGEQGEN